MKQGLGLFTTLVLLVLPLATAAAQGPLPPPERLPPGEHDGGEPEAQAWGLPGIAGRAETAQPTSFVWQIETVDSAGDVGAYTFLALPRLPMAIVLYLGEEGLPPSVNVLFDATAAEYLPTEDLILIGEYLSAALLEQKGLKSPSSAYLF